MVYGEAGVFDQPIRIGLTGRQDVPTVPSSRYCDEMMSFVLFIFIILAVGAVIFFIFTSRTQARKSDKAAKAAPDLLIENVRAGGVIGLTGVGPEGEDFDLVVKARHVYDEDGFLWYELECERGAETVWIGIEDDDELKVWLSLRKLELHEVGLTPESLRTIEKNDTGNILFDNRSYHYEECGKAMYYKKGDRSHGKKIRYWDFETKDGAFSIGVEEWGEGKNVAYLSEILRPSQITVYGLSDD